MKLYVCFLCYVLIFQFLLLEGQSQEIIHKTVDFKWAVLQKDRNKNITSVTPDKLTDTRYTNEIIITEKDQFKIFFQPEKNAYIYIFLYKSNKDLIILFPQNKNQFKEYIYFGNSFFLPAENTWLNFNKQTGMAKIYFIASANHITKLEKLIQNLLDLLDQNTEKTIQTGRIKQKIIHEIINLKKQHLHNDAYTGLPVPIAGSIRGEEKKLHFNATHMQIKNFYLKTIFFKYRK